MKKMITLILSAVMIMASLAGCGSKTNDAITVISREEGSGTRDAFTGLFGIENTVSSSEITSSTSVMLTTVAGNKNAIGYVSLGSLNDTVKAVQINGVDPTAENIVNGTYPICRPFNIATMGELSEAAQDFVSFILSTDGQKVVSANGYVSVSEGDFTSAQPSGKVFITGSSSVSPVMEKLIEAYKVINPNATLELQETDSSSGMSDTMAGSCDIGMASRELKDSEREGGLISTVIAMDGIAVIVNKEGSASNLTTDQVNAIYTGAVTTWSEAVK